MTGTVDINTTTWNMSVVSETNWSVVIYCSTDLGMGSGGSNDYPYWARQQQGSGNLDFDVSTLPAGSFLAELHELGLGTVDALTFEKTNDPGETHNACIAGYCQKVAGIGLDECSPTGNYCEGDFKNKELVTNLTSNETLVTAAIKLTSSPCADIEYIGKKQDGNNWIFTYNLRTTCGYTEMGAGAGLAKFISTNWASIATLLVSLGVVTIVWMWRDAVIKQEEVRADISRNDKDSIDGILNNTALTPDQKTALISEILKKARLSGTDWVTTLLYIISILAAAYILGEYFKSR